MSSARVPLLDVGRGNRPLLEEINEAIASVCADGRFLHGPDVRDFEAEICKYTGAEHAVSCASGSDALLLCMMAYGIGPGDEVIVPSFTFFATASAAWRLGAKPVFVDIEESSMNMDPQRLEEAITPKTKMIVPVHLFGQCADMKTLMAIGEKHGIPVLEDAAQAIGAKHMGRGAGSIGDAACFSFYPTKNLGGFGDGGMITTNSAELADQLRLFSSHGMRPRYYHSVVGINSRLDTIQAAVLRIKLRHLDGFTQGRRDNAQRYHDLIADRGLGDWVKRPVAVDHDEHVWNQYTIRVAAEQRDELRTFLGEREVGTEIYYPVPLHQQECFSCLEVPTGSLKVTEEAAKEAIALPIFPELTEDEQVRVVDALAEYQQSRLRGAA